MSQEDNEKEKKAESAKVEPKEMSSQTSHQLVVNGHELKYTVTTGTMLLKEESGREEKSEGEKAKASIFYVSYTLDNAPAGRPITFSFNGGPGSSSVWLHLGILGPRRVLMDEIGNPLPPPAQLVDNEYTLLDVSDLVFIDPVSTGYSRVVAGEKAKDFHGFSKDIESVGDFIRLYISRYQRWNSPKFLIGESYGTTRAGGLSGYLQERHGLYLNGLMLISCVLNFMTLDFGPGNELPHILYLPTYAATAWYHDKLPADLQQRPLADLLAEVGAFAEGEYTLALMKGAKLSSPERQQIAEKVARYSGLSTDYVERTDLRVEIHRFIKELRRSERRTVGRLDSRFTGIDRDAVGENHEFDPSYANIVGPYTAAFNDYVRRELQFESDLPYEILNFKVWPWSYDKHQNEYVNVGETLRQAICQNPYLKVFVANGYFDLATPYFATEYTFNHLALDESLQGNVSMAYYPAGHMMYIHLPSLAQLKQDLTHFIQSAIA